MPSNAPNRFYNKLENDKYQSISEDFIINIEDLNMKIERGKHSKMFSRHRFGSRTGSGEKPVH